MTNPIDKAALRAAVERVEARCLDPWGYRLGDTVIDVRALIATAQLLLSEPFEAVVEAASRYADVCSVDFEGTVIQMHAAQGALNMAAANLGRALSEKAP